jgi:hypothetical protein
MEHAFNPDVYQERKDFEGRQWSLYRNDSCASGSFSDIVPERLDLIEDVASHKVGQK